MGRAFGHSAEGVAFTWVAALSSLVSGQGCDFAGDEAATELALKYMITSMTKASAPNDIYSRHAVLVVPTDPINGGGGIGIDMYSALPKKNVGGNFTTSFTKFVVAAHSTHQGQKMFAFGDDVCGASGYTDSAAANYLQTQIDHLGSFGPEVTNCSQPGICIEHLAPGLQQQLPFLGALLGPTRSLKGNLMPLMMHGQGIRLGSRLGDALASLTKAGAVWAAERVLFIFVGDLSVGLLAVQADVCDTKTVEIATQMGVPQIAEYFDTLLSGKTREGCQGPRAAPVGYASILAGARVAAKLKLLRRRSFVSHRTKYTQDLTTFEKTVRGFASMVFWDDTRSPGEVLGAEGGASLLASGEAGPHLPPLSSQQNLIARHRDTLVLMVKFMLLDETSERII
eukprot:CAMPEP_0183514424 /NCGR_PEP_ID=MMETSP0371-20130417/12868_1 /TAXON_ID=268820 /ORGANISM="Peridinium aciculiferum, Strain PAER-2" /LENGTH=396 /DNA_ID=CAMNT_0025711819 /DNA_START=1 /DNA_END=1192 /DNA_ORIENTATION=-